MEDENLQKCSSKFSGIEKASARMQAVLLLGRAMAVGHRLHVHFSKMHCIDKLHGVLYRDRKHWNDCD